MVQTGFLLAGSSIINLRNNVNVPLLFVCTWAMLFTNLASDLIFFFYLSALQMLPHPSLDNLHSTRNLAKNKSAGAHKLRVNTSACSTLRVF